MRLPRAGQCVLLHLCVELFVRLIDWLSAGGAPVRLYCWAAESNHRESACFVRFELTEVCRGERGLPSSLPPPPPPRTMMMTHALTHSHAPSPLGPPSTQLQCNSTLAAAAAAALLPIREEEEEKLRKKRDRSKVFSTLIRDRRRIRVRPKDSD